MNIVISASNEFGYLDASVIDDLFICNVKSS